MTVTVVVWAGYATALVLRREAGLRGTPPRLVAPRRVRARRRRPPADPFRVVKLALAGVSHHNAAIELRERVAIGLEAAGTLARSLTGGSGGGCEAVVLSTCNRTELYLAAQDDEALGSRADEALLALAGDDAEALAPVAYRLADESAALHLFRVAAGLDSLVPGRGRDPRAGARRLRGRRARPACSTGRSAWRSTPVAARGSRRRSARARRRSPPPRPRSPSRSSRGWRAVASCSSAQGGRAS